MASLPSHSASAPIIERWNATVERFGARVAVRADDETMVFDEIALNARLVAESLRSIGAKGGDPVVVTLRRGPAWAWALLGCWIEGCVAVPVPFGRELPERFVDAVRLVDDPSEAMSVRLIQATDGPGRPNILGRSHAYVLRTSGTSGQRKMAAITHRTLDRVMAGLGSVIGIEPGERALHVASFGFSSSIRQLLVPLLAGASITLLSTDESFDPGQLLSTIERDQITSVDLTPGHLAVLVRRLSRSNRMKSPWLRRTVVASEVLESPLGARWMDLTNPNQALFHLYGQTETGGSVSAVRLAPPIDCSLTLPLALPFPPFEAHFGQPDAGRCELLLGGLDDQDGLLAEEGLDRSRFVTSTVDGKTLYATGDMFVRRGLQMVFAGRSDALLKVGGHKVDVGFVERCAAACPGVATAVAGVIERTPGVQALAIVVAPSAEHDRLRADTIRESVIAASDSPIPSLVVVQLNELPLNQSGKVDRAEALDRAQRMAQSDRSDDPNVDVLWQRYTSQDFGDVDAELAPGSDFFGEGGDSLSMIELLTDIEELLGIRIEPEAFLDSPTRRFIESHLSAESPSPKHTRTSEASVAEMNPSAAPERRPLTEIQEQMWIAERIGSPASASSYWVELQFEVETALNVAKVNRAMARVIARHDALRLRFVESNGGRPCMYLGPLDGTPSPLAGPMGDHPMIGLRMRVDGSMTTIAIVAHHSIADRRSLLTVVHDLALELDDSAAQTHANAPSFVDWAIEQRSLAASRIDSNRAFWADYLPRPVGHREQATPDMRRARVADGRAVRSGPKPLDEMATWIVAFSDALSKHGVRLPSLIGIDVELRGPSSKGLVGPCFTSVPVVVPSATGSPVEQWRRTRSSTLDAIAHSRPGPRGVIDARDRPTGDPRQPFFLHKLVYRADEWEPMAIDGATVRVVAWPAGLAEGTSTLFVGPGTEVELAWDESIIPSIGAAAILEHTVANAALPPPDDT